MTQHRDHTRHDHHAHHPHADGQPNGHEEGLAELLDLDAEVLGSYLDDVTGWIEQLVPAAPGRIVDLGAGTGTGSVALARRFGEAEVVAVDRSAMMLDRVRAAGVRAGVADRLRVAQADLDVAWPEVGTADLAWASSSLHEATDPDRVLRDVHAALNPGGLLVVVEMDELPRFLPDDLGFGRLGLEARCHDALAKQGWNSHPDWRPHLERAGFTPAEQRTFTVEGSPAPPATGRYAHTYLRRIRAALDEVLAADDRAALDHLLVDDDPAGVLHRHDLTLQARRTAWAARRP